MKKTIRTGLFALVVAVVTVLAFVNAAASGGTATARSKLTLIAPAAPGGGWDGFAREAQQALRSNGVVNNPQVVNVPGAGGTIGLSQFVQTPGREDALLVTGGVMVGAIELADNPESMADVVPIARLADDYAVLVVPADSEIQTLADFLDAWKANPGANSIGGGSLGSIDHLLSGLLAQKSGIDPRDVNYVAYSGGGEALTSLLSHTTVAGMSGYNEVADQIEAGTLRALAISSEERLDGVDVPTFMEQGVDVSMSNWRGVVAAPGISDEAKAEFIAIITEMRDSEEWKDTLERNSWTDSFATGEEFEAFIEEEVSTAQSIVKELGL
ncbi:MULTISPECIES: tripartite tricarboxylate transporter substrate binding protein [unclassified Arthrobacter]|uniref:tripartite tricarboxylate transporter substrate binding protein n=1 Tax=unclassified Arthrobacter TaxID=235627 RepID=UPI001D13EAB5|nr:MULTISPECIES: tripartite tricarboxylate transporter substrate-binding protein [unclassified Arthrobacter]MCC3277415.1 tripartite tricarboxylate transporter substrate binding protein [Arthrobacter sp. zg-Y20]MCC9178265.1 tripartite tricarboxylate transporter substrate binding protein [Arthrobacter sp. zg-Y750]MDK1317575.1 tripartite tricarboxylate transporter substrate-binding protein [Arthrobacter sp. zg.Y20]MDK1328339.1 tripartite tricarboxylate transporter substrate-binding protein [Arthro